MSILLFPGQGSQSPEMGKWLYDNFKVAKETFEEGSDSLNINLKKLIFEGSETDLALTANTQPALLCVSTATQRVLRSETSVKIEAAAGHSVGEYAALVAAKTLSYPEAIKAVRKRGEEMQSAVPIGHGGMMAVLGLEPDQVNWVCRHVVTQSQYSPLEPANYNSPGQIVISGSTQALNWLTQNAKSLEIPGSPSRVKFIPLAVSAPFHCSMMSTAEDNMRKVLTTMSFSQPEFPICQNFTAVLESDPLKIRENLIRQISAPVLWTQSILHLKERGHLHFIECGHGSVLKGLLKKIDPENLIVESLNSIEDLKAMGQ